MYTSCLLPYKEVTICVSTVRDKNSLVGINFRKISRVIVIGCFDEKKSKFLILLRILRTKQIGIYYFCKVSAYTCIFFSGSFAYCLCPNKMAA